MELKEAIQHAREIAENGCGDGSFTCAYQHDKLADWLNELAAFRAAGLTPDQVMELVETMK